MLRILIIHSIRWSWAFMDFFLSLPEIFEAMAQVILSMGSNLGNRMETLQHGLSRLSIEAGNVKQISAVYESVAWGFSVPERFLNLAVAIETELMPRELLKLIHQIEESFGRVRDGSTYRSRTLDIDIIFYEEDVIHEPDLSIPHRLMHQRLFVLLPLLDLVPNMVHPVLGKTMKELFEQCSDASDIQKYSDFEFQPSFVE